MKDMSEIIKESRKCRGLTLKKASAEIGISMMYLIEIENGRKIPLDGKILNKIANYYALSFTMLLKSAYNQKYNQVRLRFSEDKYIDAEQAKDEANATR